MLYRSLYFLFHDEHTARTAIKALENELGLDGYRLHAITHEGHTLLEQPGATMHKKSAAAIRTEKLLWYASIGIFTLALIALALTLLAASWYWAIFFGALVLGAQFSGYLFGNRVPNAQLERFRTGMERGHIVLQVVVPRSRVKSVKTFIAEHYPSSTTNISNWHVGIIGP